MNIMRPEEYQERIQPIPPFRVHIVSYRLGDKFHCSVDNVDPGAVIARSQGSTRAEAESKALERATSRLGVSAARMNP
jgi:hypothetical protein